MIDFHAWNALLKENTCNDIQQPINAWMFDNISTAAMKQVISMHKIFGWKNTHAR